MYNLLYSQNDAFSFSVTYPVELYSFVQGYNPSVAVGVIFFIFPQILPFIIYMALLLF